MKIEIWKDPSKDGRYFFAIKHEDATLSAVVGDFSGHPGAIALLIEIIKRDSELGENYDE